jgi:hypothetical protein
VAVAHALVYAIYNRLHYRRPYRPLPTPAGPGQQRTQRLIRHHRRRLKQLKARSATVKADESSGVMCSDRKSGFANGGNPVGIPPNLVPTVSIGRAAPP